MAIKSRHPNILLIAIDSLRRDHMSCYGYHRLTTPHIDRFAQEATLFDETISAHIPTTSAYASMLTGRDCFGTEVVALRHKGGLTEKVITLPEILRKEGYDSTCVGFTGNPSSRGFSKYLDYSAWGGWSERPLRKAHLLNEVALPEIDRLSRSPDPWFMMLRHMDPHAPYLPPAPFDSIFYGNDPCEPDDTSMDPVRNFKPMASFHLSWMPPGITDRHYVDAQYDGAIAYMDACIAAIFEKLEALGIADDTIVVLNGDHGETLYEHDCYYDHHGLYETNLVVPLIIRYPRKLPKGRRVSGLNQHKDLVPTLLELAGLQTGLDFDGSPLTQLMKGKVDNFEREIYITECTWMRKHGWRSPQWKLIIALEPDFHFKPSVELYHLATDPLELENVARENPDVVATLKNRMEAFITNREKELSITNPILNQGDWHGKEGIGSFMTSKQAYDTLLLQDANTAKRLQARARK